MTRPRKSDKPNEEDPDEAEAPKMAPWGCEIEFYDKPSFMSSVLELSVNSEHISITQETGTILAFPYELVRKVLIMHAEKKEVSLD